METHETQGDSWGLMKLKILIKTHSHSCYSWTLLGIHKTKKYYCGLMRLMRLRETTGDSCDSYRQLWTLENQKDHLCHEKNDNLRLMGTQESQGD